MRSPIGILPRILPHPPGFARRAGSGRSGSAIVAASLHPARPFSLIKIQVGHPRASRPNTSCLTCNGPRICAHTKIVNPPVQSSGQLLVVRSIACELRLKRLVEIVLHYGTCSPAAPSHGIAGSGTREHSDEEGPRAMSSHQPESGCRQPPGHHPVNCFGGGLSR